MYHCSFPFLPLPSIAGIPYRYSGLVVLRDSIRQKKNVTKQKTCKTYLDHEYNSYAMMATTETEYLEGMLGEIANLSKRKEKG